MSIRQILLLLLLTVTLESQLSCPPKLATSENCTVTSDTIQGRIQQPTEQSKLPIRARYLAHVTDYQPIRDQYLLIRSVHVGYHPYVNRLLGNDSSGLAEDQIAPENISKCLDPIT